MSQPQEINNFITTTITELKRYKKKDPKINYNDAILKSKWYTRITNTIDKKILNKFKSKIAHFWFDTYENSDLNLTNKSV